MPFECPQEVINDYEKSFENEEYDVIIYAGKNEKVKEIQHIHSYYIQGLNFLVQHSLRNGR